MPTPIPAPDSPAPRPKRFYQSLWVQVTVAIALAIVFGYLSPKHAVAMKPLGDAFIRLITMLITVMIFCTVVTGIAGMRDLRKVGRVGGKALLYFEIISMRLRSMREPSRTMQGRPKHRRSPIS
jgi:aerobic C4-dicarboxylate transport protein